MTPVLASPYAAMTVAGTFNGWNTGLTNMLLVTNSLWQCDAGFLRRHERAIQVRRQWQVGDELGRQQPDANQSAAVRHGTKFRREHLREHHHQRRLSVHFNDQTLAYSLQPLAIVSPQLHGQVLSGNQSGSLTFTNFPGTRFTVYASTNLNLPLSQLERRRQSHGNRAWPVPV